MQTVVFRLSQSESKIYKLCFFCSLCSRENRHPERQSGLQGGVWLWIFRLCRRFSIDKSRNLYYNNSVEHTYSL